MLSEIKNGLVNVQAKIDNKIWAILGPSTVMSMLAIHVAAADEADAENAVKGIIDVMLDIFKYIGIILLVWGIGQLVLAFRNEDADSKTRAVMLLVAAAALLTLPWLLSQVPSLEGYLS